MKSFLVYGLGNGWGGVEAIIMSMVKILSSKAYFDIILPEGNSSYEKNYLNDNIRFVHIPSWGNNRKGFAKGLKEILHKRNYNFVWINGCVMSNKDIISVSKKYACAKIITHSHGSSLEEGNIIKRGILLFLHYLNRPFYLRNTDLPCMCSKNAGLWLFGKKYMSDHYVHLVKNGIDIKKYRFKDTIRKEYRHQLGLSDELALFHAGRLTAVKNQKKILSVFNDLMKENVNARLFIAGAGELRHELEDYARSLNIINRVNFLGNRSDVDKLYQAMDVMLLPSFHEGFPVTIVEAQTAGLPCLVSNTITKEANITGLVEYLPIHDNSNADWVKAIKSLSFKREKDRENYAKIVFSQGYDISTVCNDFMTSIDYHKA